MTKIARYDGNYLAFASSSTSAFRTVFGDTTQSNTLDANMITDYFLGWEKVTNADIPPREWFNAVAYTISHTLAYTHQMGVAEWNTSQEYHTGSSTTYSGSLYISQSDTNTGNNPSTDAVNWEVVALISDLENASSIIYDNVTSGLASTTVQGAIDELRDSDNILYDDSLTSLGADVQAAIDALFIASRIPSGAVQYFAMSTAPTGWLKADGVDVSRATYSGLFSAIGTTFGIGDGSLTFGLPDLRGEFIRGYDNGRGVDTGRVFGSAQDQQLEDHAHGFDVYTEMSAGGGRTVLRNAGTAILGGTVQDGTTDIGTETRPRNIALLTCIKI